jgi:LPXTG-site transpeptidase (sortase) family protein
MYSFFSPKRSGLGNLLIIISIVLLAYIYFPLASYYFYPSTTNAHIDSGYFIKIPKISAQATIVDDVDPFNKSEYEKALEKGVARAKGYDNFYFAHSSQAPWKITRTNTPFLRLGELEKGDQIIIHKDGKDLVYKVSHKKEVWPGEVQFLKGEEDLILQTCTPIGTDFKRLLIFGKLA